MNGVSAEENLPIWWLVSARRAGLGCPYDILDDKDNHISYSQLLCLRNETCPYKSLHYLFANPYSLIIVDSSFRGNDKNTIINQ